MATEEKFESPPEMLSRLERLGEERVRSLVESEYFHPRAIPLVQGWLAEKDRRRGLGSRAETDRREKVLEDLGVRLRRAEAAIKRAVKDAAAARQALEKSTRVTRAALILGSLGVVASIVSLLVSAL